MGRRTWAGILLIALVATGLTVAAVLTELDGRPAVYLIEPGREGPSVHVVRRDFPDTEFTSLYGHDGQQFYAVARQPMHVEAAGDGVDRPHYRLQRILYPALAWALHPQGGGVGLVIALFAVGVGALFLGTVATARLAETLRAPLLVAMFFPLLPIGFLSLRLSTSDALALALALLAVDLSLRGRHRWAAASGVAAVLAKEVYLLVLVGLAIWRRDRAGLALVAVPAAVAGTWALVIRLLTEDPRGGREVGAPLAGVIDGWQGSWSSGENLLAFVSLLAGVVLGVAALVKGGVRSPLGWAIAIQLATVPFLTEDVLRWNSNAPRVLGPLVLLAILQLSSSASPDELRELRGRGASRRAPEPPDRAASSTPAGLPATPA